MGSSAALESLASGGAFVDLSFWRKVEVAGPEALEWLDALVSAPVGDLAPGRSREALLLSPTGAVRAAFTVAVAGPGVLLLQEPGQRRVDELLAPYVLSADVHLDDRSEDLSLFALPNRAAPPDVAGARWFSPSCLGPGVGLTSPSREAERVLRSLRDSLAEAATEDVEAWRIARGRPRIGVDVGEGDLPQEAALDAAASADKGCYLGQEAVAKVRNLGHPRRLLLALGSDRPVAAGDAVLVADEEVGRVTSAARAGGRWVALARVRWERREGPFRTGTGAALAAAPAD